MFAVAYTSFIREDPGYRRIRRTIQPLPSDDSPAEGAGHTGLTAGPKRSILTSCAGEATVAPPRRPTYRQRGLTPAGIGGRPAV